MMRNDNSYRVRNAYQKIRVGDQVRYRGFGCTILATVTSKGNNGLMEVRTEDGKTGRLMGCDVVQICRAQEEPQQ